MSVNTLDPLTRDQINSMNTAALGYGPSGADAVTEGECEDLGDYLLLVRGGVVVPTPPHTVRRWFGVHDAFGRTPQYRRLVPVSAPPGTSGAYTAIGNRIGRMYPTATMAQADAYAIQALRHRCVLGAAMLAIGLEQDSKYSGKAYIDESSADTLSSCLDYIDDLMSGDYGDHGQWLMGAWYRVTITHTGDELPWLVTVYYNAMAFGDQS